MEKLDRTSDYDYEYEIYFGTNESLDFSPRDVIDMINDVLKQKPISEDDAKVIERVFEDYSTAVISLSEIVERILVEATDNGYDENEDEDDIFDEDGEGDEESSEDE